MSSSKRKFSNRLSETKPVFPARMATSIRVEATLTTTPFRNMLDLTSAAASICDSEFDATPLKAYVYEETTPREHTLSQEREIGYPGGNFGQRLSRNFLDDPRIQGLRPQTLGTYVMVRAYFEVGNPVPANPTAAARKLRMSRTAWLNSVAELTACDAPMIEMREGNVWPTSFGRPVKKSTSEARSLAAQARWGQVKVQDGVPRRAEPSEPVEPEQAELVETQTSLFEKNQEPSPKGTSKAPFQEISEAFVAACPGLAKPSHADKWPGTRKARVQERWSENPDIGYFKEFFASVAASDFLMGRSGQFQAKFDWLFHPPNFIKVIEGNYKNRGNARQTSVFTAGAFQPSDYGGHDIPTNADWMTAEPEGAAA